METDAKTLGSMLTYSKCLFVKKWGKQELQTLAARRSVTQTQQTVLIEKWILKNKGDTA